MKSTTPYGLWPSPIAPADVAKGARRLGQMTSDGTAVFWTEGRPEEAGRQVIMRAAPGSQAEDLLPKPFSARTRVHEYGGGELLVAEGRIFFVNDPDQDIWELKSEGTPVRITREPNIRFADMTLDTRHNRLIAAGEIAKSGTAHGYPDNVLVAIDLSTEGKGQVTTLAKGRDFYAFPRLSPDGTRLAFLGWDLPEMPWDQAGLYVAPVDAQGRIGKPGLPIAGGDGSAAMQPAWLSDGRLVFLSDKGGWGNFWIWDGATAKPLTRLKADLSLPLWNLGVRSFVVTPDDRLIASGQHAGVPTVVTVSGLDGRTPEISISEPSIAGIGALAVVKGGFVGAIARAKGPSALAMFSFKAKAPPILHTLGGLDLSGVAISVGKTVSFKSGDRQTTFAQYYPPANRACRAPRGTLPPALILAHGGPTSSAGRGLAPRIQFYTSRGFAVLDVDYAGSTGYGRRYRERLDGAWGIADVADCAAAAAFLAKDGLADPARIAIAGGSAGGYTVLMALATTKAFAAGSSHYGISDLGLLMAHTHKFEAGYLHRLMGTTAKAWKRTCEQRSPLTLIDGITSPAILFQGLDDKVVPPEQSRLIAEKLKARGIPVALHEFAGEGHGFRRAETIVAVLEAELAFLIEAMGIK